MPEKLFIVYLNGAPDPMDLGYRQPVRASIVEVSESGITFRTSDGAVAAYFEKSAVRTWCKSNESERLPS
jgi:hypothetical protein